MKMLPGKSARLEENRCSTIWAVVEARQTFPAVIAVASASPVDDTESVARGLCHASLEAGKATAYLYLGRSRSAPHGEHREYADLSVTGREAERSRLDASLAMWRTSYDVIIVEIPLLASVTLGAHVARIADGVIVALYPQRPVLKVDHELTTLFSQLGAKMIGVVKTEAVSATQAAEPAKARSIGSYFFPVRQR